MKIYFDTCIMLSKNGKKWEQMFDLIKYILVVLFDVYVNGLESVYNNLKGCHNRLV